MSNLKEFADQLQQEVVTDMAENYFGDRKNLDDMIEAYYSMVEEFRSFAPRLSQAAARLHCLLLDRQTARNFYISLDILPSCIPFSEEEPQPFFDRLPFAFTSQGRYEKCVCRAYSMFQQVADEYINGHYFEDPEAKGRKRLTVHYLRLKALAEYINDEIKRVNESQSTSGTLRFVRSMNPENLDKINLLGDVCLLEGCGIDDDLKFEPLDFEGLGLPVVQELPALHKVKSAISDFCKEIYPSREADILKAMAVLRDG